MKSNKKVDLGSGSEQNVRFSQSNALAEDGTDTLVDTHKSVDKLKTCNNEITPQDSGRTEEHNNEVDILDVDVLVGTDPNSGSNHTSHDTNDVDPHIKDQFVIENITNINNLDDDIDIGNIDEQISSSFPTIEVIKNVQQHRKKRQFSTNTVDDEEMSRLEFQQWTSGFLNDDVIDIDIDDVNSYDFPQTTAAHFTDIVDDQHQHLQSQDQISLPHIPSQSKKKAEKRQRKRQKLLQKQQQSQKSQKQTVGQTKAHQLETLENETLQKITKHTKNKKSAANQDHMVDPELANLDGTDRDEMLRSLNTYLNPENPVKEEHDLAAKNKQRINISNDGRNVEDVDNAVEEVNRAVSQAVAAVHADVGNDDSNNHNNDAVAIAAAVVAAENEVRKRLQSAGMDLELHTGTGSSHTHNNEKKNIDEKDNLFSFFNNEEPSNSGKAETSTGKRAVQGNRKAAKSATQVKKDSMSKTDQPIAKLEIEHSKIVDAIFKARQTLPPNTSFGRSFAKEEAFAIDVFVSEYQQIHNMTREMFLQRIWGNERKKDKFWENIQQVLPDRSRSSLYKHVRRTYHIFEKRGVWTEEEDIKLAELAKNYEGKWKYIGETMKRMPEDCRDRWRNYVKCGDNRNVNKWTKEEEEKLQNIIQGILETERLKMLEMKNSNEKNNNRDVKDMELFTNKQISEAQVSPTINWTTISELMGGTRSRIQCRYKWKKIMKTQSMKKLREMDHETKLWMLEKIKELGESDPNIEANLDWNALALTVPDSMNKNAIGDWNGVDLSTCFQRLRSTIDWKGKTFSEVVDILIATLTTSSYLERMGE